MERMTADIEELKSITLDMGDLALSMLDRALTSLDKDDPGVIKDIDNDRKRILKMDDHIEQSAFRILMIYQPMASDMRLVATVLKMITYFERIGKYGFNIAHYSLELKDVRRTDVFSDIRRMGIIATSMIRGTMVSLKTNSIPDPAEYHEMEEELDSLRRKVFIGSIGLMTDPERIDEANIFISASRYLERTGDYACKLAEKISFMVSGERMNIC